MSKVQQVAMQLAEKTSEQGLLSFSGGIKNLIGARKTSRTMRVRIKNALLEDRLIYFAPNVLLGGNPTAAFINGSNEIQKLPVGKHFSNATETIGEGDSAVSLTVESLNQGQELSFLASGFSVEPTQVTKLSLRSFSIGGVPENTNYGNDLTSYFLSPYKEPVRNQTLNFAQFQNSRDTSTELLTVDLVDNNFDALISQSDVFAIKINAGTYMDVTMNVGARLSHTELFQRMVSAGSEVIRDNYPNGGECSC